MTQAQVHSAIMIAANSIEALRCCDVFRVLEQNTASIRSELAEIITRARPDLADEVSEIMAEGF